MKKILVGLIALTMFGGCSKDDNAPDNNQKYETLIQGNWEIVKESVIVYDADNNVLLQEPVDDAVGIKWELKGGVITSQYKDEEGDTSSGTYVLNEKVDPPTIQIQENSNDGGGQDEPTLLNITSLNDRDMVLEVNQDVSDFPDSDIEGADHAIVRFELERY